MNERKLAAAFVVLVSMVGGAAPAQTVVALPDSGASTTLTAHVAEQAEIFVPAGIGFDVQNLARSTSAGPASVTVSHLVLRSAAGQLRISIQAEAAAFTPPAGGAATWAASDVSWNAADWTNATGAAGTMSAGSYNQVAICDTDVADCSTTGLTFTLAAKPSVTRSGDHALSLTWKFESIEGGGGS